ncbi:Eco57I restriction-modification methylase domain-containing protein [Curtobacterium sp. RRHDQ66]|uniref:Eco57I restriction-modification methylase domain-containing protein n=1 Tax=Curtobacterium guangdongense TaxID=3413380 RepID=UPI003BF25787
MAQLFGRNRLREEAARIPTEDIIDKIAILSRWHKDQIQGTLKKDSETQREQQWNQDVFIEILGYRMKPLDLATFEPKASTAFKKIPDARIGNLGSSENTDDTIAVVELKGATVDLDKPQSRNGHLTPVQQGFMYRPMYRGASFVIVSNFIETRLYNDNQLDYESWFLSDLVSDTDDFLAFKTFYLLLRADRLLRRNGYSATEQMLSDVRIEQEQIGNSFYDDYKTVRTLLLQDLYRNNESVQKDLNLGINKAQKILDRIVFACFAEDGGLLPDDTLTRALSSYVSSPFSFWSGLKTLFSAIDKGDSKLGIDTGYNGGLFAPDAELDQLVVGDDVVRSLMRLGVQYDFQNDLSVTILGHIFEQSIADLQEIRERVGESEHVTVESLSAGRRRSDGIYYTPEYIVRHMIDRTLGEYLRAQEVRIRAEELLHDGLNADNYSKREQRAYLRYRDEVLISVKVVDAACGSGAFLTSAFDFLQADHKRVAAILGNDIFDNTALTGIILRDNLFGVDINEESVEITRLSLWLKSAKRNTKLTGLEKNIRVGNSLRRKSGSTGEPAFDWATEFPAVFANGGFDAVAMNPPYIKENTNREAFDAIRDLSIYQGKMDLWYAFGALALDIVKPQSGRIAFIAPSNWITNSGAANFRNEVSHKGKLLEYWDFGDTFIFDDAGIQTMIYVMARDSGDSEYTFPYARIADNKRLKAKRVQEFLLETASEDFLRFEARLRRNSPAGAAFHFRPAAQDDLVKRIEMAAPRRLSPAEVAQGIVAPQDTVNKAAAAKLGDSQDEGRGVFVLKHAEVETLQLSAAERALLKPFFTSEQLGRYWAQGLNQAWVIYTDSRFRDPDLMSPYPRLKTHLDRFAPIITSHNAPYGLHRSRDRRFFEGAKILSIRKSARPVFTYNNVDCYVSQTYNVIKPNDFSTLGLTALLNTRAAAFWFRSAGKMQGSLYQIDKDPLVRFPLPAENDLSELAPLAQQNLKLRADLARLDTTFAAVTDSILHGWHARHRAWWELDAASVLRGLSSALSLPERESMVEVFEKFRNEASLIVNSILSLEREADEIAYLLYSLSEDDILMVESSISAPPVRLP